MSIICKIVNFLEKRSKFNKIVNELNSFSDRELRDIGIDRADIYAIAEEALND